MATKKGPKEEQLAIGLKALTKCIKTKADVPNAFLRIGFGYITLIYGEVGNPKDDFKPGYGITHILAKRNYENKDGLEVAKKLIEVLIYGTIQLPAKKEDQIEKIVIVKDGYLATVALKWYGNNISWLLSGYKLKK